MAGYFWDRLYIFTHTYIQSVYICMYIYRYIYRWIYVYMAVCFSAKPWLAHKEIYIAHVSTVNVVSSQKIFSMSWLLKVHLWHVSYFSCCKIGIEIDKVVLRPCISPDFLWLAGSLLQPSDKCIRFPIKFQNWFHCIGRKSDGKCLFVKGNSL